MRMAKEKILKVGRVTQSMTMYFIPPKHGEKVENFWSYMKFKPSTPTKVQKAYFKDRAIGKDVKKYNKYWDIFNALKTLKETAKKRGYTRIDVYNGSGTGSHELFGFVRSIIL